MIPESVVFAEKKAQGVVRRATHAAQAFLQEEMAAVLVSAAVSEGLVVVPEAPAGQEFVVRTMAVVTERKEQVAWVATVEAASVMPVKAASEMV